MRSIIYVNFAPYENAGHILNFLLENFEQVFLFVFDFHKIEKGVGNRFKVFKKGKLEREYPLFQFSIPEFLIFPLLPLRSFLIFIQVVALVLLIRLFYRKPDYYFTVNGYTAWIGNILKDLRLVEITVFWVWDYYPPIHTNVFIRNMRKIYWQFDKIATHSSRTIFLNKKLQDLRQKMGILEKGEKYPVIPIGTKPTKRKKRLNSKAPVLGFIGVLKKSQGLDLVFDNASAAKRLFPNLKLEVIGTGPDERWLKKRGQESLIETIFHGFISSEKDIGKIAKNWDIGIAVYKPERSNPSYFGDPSKVKKYLSLGIPVITTDVFSFAQEVEKEKAGVVIDYSDNKQLINALKKIISDYDFYHENAVKLSKKYDYRLIYPKLFKD